MKKYLYIGLASLSVPFITFAQNLGGTNTLLNSVLRSINQLIGIAVLIAFLYFVWGIAQFIRKADDASGREEGRNRMIWGVVALAVLATIWGIVAFLNREFGINQQSAPGIFQLFQQGGGSSGGSSGGAFNVGEDGYGNQTP